MMAFDQETLRLLLGIFGLLSFASLVVFLLRSRIKSKAGVSTLQNLSARIKAWWIMTVIFVFAMLTGGTGSVVLFALISFLALREFITLTPTRKADHRSLFWAFFIIIPYQYFLVGTQYYGMFSIFIPVYAFLFIPIQSLKGEDYERFLERTAKIQWGLMICVYCASHAPALLMLKIPNFSGQNAKLLFFLVLVVQLSDVFQYVFGKMLGRTPIMPKISPHKTVEGFVGGIVAATFIGSSLWWLTPFTVWQAAGMAFLIAMLGFFGGATMSAIKRDRGVKDYGNLIEGHGGMLDRIDSLCFAAPVYFHLIRFYST